MLARLFCASKANYRFVFVTSAARIWLPLRFFLLFLQFFSHRRKALSGNDKSTHTMLEKKWINASGNVPIPFKWQEISFYKWINMFFSTSNRRKKRKFFPNWCLFPCIHFHIVWNLFASADLLFRFRCVCVLIWLNDILSGILDKINNKRNSTENGNIKRTTAGEFTLPKRSSVSRFCDTFSHWFYMLSCIQWLSAMIALPARNAAVCLCANNWTLAKGEKKALNRRLHSSGSML